MSGLYIDFANVHDKEWALQSQAQASAWKNSRTQQDKWDKIQIEIMLIKAIKESYPIYLVYVQFLSQWLTLNHWLLNVEQREKKQQQIHNIMLETAKMYDVAYLPTIAAQMTQSFAIVQNVVIPGALVVVVICFINFNVLPQV